MVGQKEKPLKIIWIRVIDRELRYHIRKVRSQFILGSHNFTFLNRSAFPITDTELKLIAALAIMGLKSKPKKG